MEQVYGHEVMRMMIEAGRPYSKISLEHAIHEKFGPETRFYTCSAQNMTALELIEFLDTKGKFLSKDDGYTTEPSRICDH